jgi:hypothetical protein
LARINLELDTEVKVYSRESYALIHLIGDLGGVTDIIVTFIGLFVSPYSSMSFRLKQIQEIFLVKTNKMTKPMKVPKDKKKKLQKLKQKVPSNHHNAFRGLSYAKFSTLDCLILALKNSLCCGWKCFLTKREKKIQRLLDQSESKLAKETSIDKMVQLGRTLRTMISHVQSDGVNFKALSKIDPENVLNMDLS